MTTLQQLSEYSEQLRRLYSERERELTLQHQEQPESSFDDFQRFKLSTQELLREEYLSAKSEYEDALRLSFA